MGFGLSSDANQTLRAVDMSSAFQGTLASSRRNTGERWWSEHGFTYVQRLGWVATGLMTLGTVEAALIAKRPVPLTFALNYAALNTLASAVWRTFPAKTLYESNMKWISQTKLIPFEITSEQSAKFVMQVEGLRMARYMLASYGTLIALLAPVKANEPEEKYFKERVLRLTSGLSNVTRASVHEHGAHVVPLVFTHGIPSFVVSATKQTEHVEWYPISDKRDSLQQAELLEQKLGFFDKSWGLETKEGKKILAVEVDFTDSFPNKELLESLGDFKRWVLKNRDALGYDDLKVVGLTSHSTIEALGAESSIDYLLNAAVIQSRALRSFLKTTNKFVYIHAEQKEYSWLSQSLLLQGYLALPPTSSEGFHRDYQHIVVAETLTEGRKKVHALRKNGISGTNICLLVDSVDRQQEIRGFKESRIIDRSLVLDNAFQQLREDIRDDSKTDNEIKRRLRRIYGSVYGITTAGYRSDRNSVINL